MTKTPFWSCASKTSSQISWRSVKAPWHQCAFAVNVWFLPRDSGEIFVFAGTSVWLFYCRNRLRVRAGVLVSLRRQWSKGSWRCWRTGVMKRYIHPLTHWCSAFTDDTFHTYSKPELCVLSSIRHLLITFLLMVFYILSFFTLDIQPAGSPHSASQGYGPSVPLQDPGYWQYWCKFLHTTLHSKTNGALSSGKSQ